MSVKFKCPQCGNELTATRIMAGRTHTCPKCHTTVTAPEETSRSNNATAPLSFGPAKREEENLIDMTAMVDIVFFLLIFFMVTSIQALQSVMEMPKPQGSAAATGQQVAPDYSTDPGYITVTIESDDSIWLDNEQIFSEQELRIKLREMREGNLQLTGLMVLGDPEASHGTLVMVLDAGATAGIEDLRFSVNAELDPFGG